MPDEEMSLWEWEPVAEDPLTERLPVPGGWIYRIVEVESGHGPTYLLVPASGVPVDLYGPRGTEIRR